MKKNPLFSLVILLLVSVGAQAQPDMGMNPPDFQPATPSPLAVVLDLRNGTISEAAVEVEEQKGVVYVEREGMPLHLNIFYPRTASSPLPCIVYVPGSAWMKQNIDMSTPNLIRLAARGYVVAAVEYRPSNVAQFPAQVQDARTAVRFMRKNSAQYHVDVDNLFAWGDSSGGHTALYLGAEPDPGSDTSVYGEFSARVNAVVDYFGPSEMKEISEIPNMLNRDPDRSPEAMLIGGAIAKNPERARAASPVYSITPEFAPTLVAHGDSDPLVPMSQSDRVAETLDREGVEYEYYCLSGASHGSREFWTDAMLDRVEAFLKKQIK
jgi:acetyl esterase/lipase